MVCVPVASGRVTDSTYKPYSSSGRERPGASWETLSAPGGRFSSYFTMVCVPVAPGRVACCPWRSIFIVFYDGLCPCRVRKGGRFDVQTLFVVSRGGVRGDPFRGKRRALWSDFRLDFDANLAICTLRQTLKAQKHLDETHFWVHGVVHIASWKRLLGGRFGTQFDSLSLPLQVHISVFFSMLFRG